MLLASLGTYKKQFSIVLEKMANYVINELKNSKKNEAVFFGSLMFILFFCSKRKQVLLTQLTSASFIALIDALIAPENLGGLLAVIISSNVVLSDRPLTSIWIKSTCVSTLRACSSASTKGVLPSDPR